MEDINRKGNVREIKIPEKDRIQEAYENIIEAKYKSEEEAEKAANDLILKMSKKFDNLRADLGKIKKELKKFDKQAGSNIENPVLNVMMNIYSLEDQVRDNIHRSW